MVREEKCFSLKLPDRYTALTSFFAILSIISIGVAGYYDDWMPKIFFVSGFVFLAIFFSIYILMRVINSREESPTTLFVLSAMEIVLIASATAMATSLTLKQIEFAIFFVPLLVVFFTTLPTLRKIKLSIPGYISVAADVIRVLLALVSFIVTFAITDIILADDKVAIVKLVKELPHEPLFDGSLAMIFFGGLDVSIILLAVATLLLSFASSTEKKDCKGVFLFSFTVGMIFFILTTALMIFLLYKFIAFDLILITSLVGIALLKKD
jgi:hypothetical protein